MIRKIFSVIIGIIVGVLGITLVQTISMQMYPWPEGLSFEDAERVKEHFSSLPVGAFLMVILSYMVGSFFAGMSATSISKEKYREAIIVGGVLTIAGIMNGMSVPQPLWVSIVSVLVFIPCAYLGAKVFPQKKI